LGSELHPAISLLPEIFNVLISPVEDADIIAKWPMRMATPQESLHLSNRAFCFNDDQQAPEKRQNDGQDKGDN
jgi:hypothetical protein